MRAQPLVLTETELNVEEDEDKGHSTEISEQLNVALIPEASSFCTILNPCKCKENLEQGILFVGKCPKIQSKTWTMLREIQKHTILHQCIFRGIYNHNKDEPIKHLLSKSVDNLEKKNMHLALPQDWSEVAALAQRTLSHQFLKHGR